jgi:SMI1 / KNR4 family (SUKH-1)
MSKISDLMQELKKNLGKIDSFWKVKTPNPNAPATARQVQSLQNHIGMNLPDDYLEFLMLNNGWANIRGGITFFSIEEIINPPEDIKNLIAGYSNGFSICAHTDEDRGIILIADQDSPYFLDIEQGSDSGKQTFTAILDGRIQELCG